MDKLLTIGMATYDDYDGVYFTVQSLRMYHDLPKDSCEFIVIDTNPESEQGKATKSFISSQIPEGKYISQNKQIPSSFNKYDIVKHADGKYILIVDCHVLLQPNAIKRLLKYYEDNPNCKNLVQGPLLYDQLNDYSTHFDPKWSGHMYGVWSKNKEAYEKGEPFEIPMQGMGLCSFEKNNWPGIYEYFHGFGGEEGYIAEKFRLNGGKNICIPQLGWCHRFGRPSGVPYRLILEDRILNYFLGWLEMYRDLDHKMVKETYEWFKDKIPPKSIDNLLNIARNALEI